MKHLPTTPARGTPEWDAWRAKLSAALKGKPKPPRSAEHIRKLTEAKRKNPRPPALLAANAKRRGTTWSHTQEARQRISEGLRRREHRPEWSVKAGQSKSAKARERFWNGLDRSSGECWLWTGALDRDGYGATHFVGVAKKAHRVAFALTNGPIPKGGCVLHRCDTPHCCRPDHLYLGTPADNARDREERGRGRWSRRK